MAADQDAQDRAATGDQRGHRDQSGGLDAEGECRGDDGQRGRRQPAVAHGALDQHIGDQRPDGDDRFGAQTVVERHPCRQQHHAGRPVRSLAGGDRGPQPGQHLTREQQPAHDSRDQVGQPHPQAGVADVGHQRQQVVVPAEGVLGAAEPAEVVRHVAGVVGDARHAQDVAVVGRVGADHMPEQEAEDHHDIGQGEGAPVRGDEPAHPVTVQLVEAPQRDQRNDCGQDRHHHRGQFQSRWGGGEPRVDGGREFQIRWGGAGQVGEYSDDLWSQVRIGETAADWFARRIGQPDEGGESAGFGRGDLDSGTAGGTCGSCHPISGSAGDHHIAVGDVHPLAVDDDEQRVERGIFALFGGRAQHDPALRWQAAHRRAGHGCRHVDRGERNQRCGNAIQPAVLWPVQGRGCLHDGQQRGGHRQHEPDQAGDGRHPARHPHVFDGRHAHGSARIGPCRLQPCTVITPCSITASGA